MAMSEGFPPVAGSDARVLILGSLPGQRSIAEQQYYAHPQNAFWRIMRELFGIEGDYPSRCRQLIAHRIALWDVLMSSWRPGSMDADIRLSSASANDFAAFFAARSSIRIIVFNGRKAAELFERFVAPSGVAGDVPRVVLPSTSPAYASMPFAAKLARWREALLGAELQGRTG